MRKRIALPEANDLLIGRKLESETPSQQSTIVEKKQKTKVEKTQISTYLTEQTLKRLEEVKYRLYAEHDVKVRKSDIIEIALVEGLSDTERLAQALRNR